MAEFCRACAKEMFPDNPEFWNDFKGITKQQDWDNGLACIVLCEGCGPIQVDPKGNCVSSDCLEKDNVDHTF